MLERLYSRAVRKLLYAVVPVALASCGGNTVGAYIGAAYFFTSSTSFANPAISVGRMFSNTFAGIAPASVPAFIVAQLMGGLAAILAISALYPEVTPADAAEVVVPHTADGQRRTADATR